MLKIGEFSKLSLTTVKALRYYEKEGLLIPVSVDKWTGYRFYETHQLETAAKIKAYRQLDLSIEEIKAIFDGADVHAAFEIKRQSLEQQKKDIDIRLSIINHILEESDMKYQVTVKNIPSAIVYYTEVCVHAFSDMMQIIPQLGSECLALNPDIKCAEPPYEFCEYPDMEHRDDNILIRHNEAVNRIGKESDRIKFREIPAVKVLSILHKGAYDEIGEAYAYIMKYAEDNGYKVCGLSRECYIDGIWNKDRVDDWLTEIQLPVE